MMAAARPVGKAGMLRLHPAALARLMPMHLGLDGRGRIRSVGPTLARIAAPTVLIGARFAALFDLRRPQGPARVADLLAQPDDRLHLVLRDRPEVALRGVVVPMGPGKGALLNLSFGIGVIEAVRRHDLTEADFAPTDLTVELLYLYEAKTAVLDELRDLNARLFGAKTVAEEQALTDPLTGLGNRRALDLALATALEDAAPFALMHLDLDGFKAVNDSLGHAAGDHVLRVVADVLRVETRTSDIIARVGGDEAAGVRLELLDPDAILVGLRRIEVPERIAFDLPVGGSQRREAGVARRLPVDVLETPPLVGLDGHTVA